MDINKAIMTGRITAEPEVKQTPQGYEVCRFTVAVDRPFAKDQTDFIDGVAWKQKAVFLGKYIHKGYKISLVGYLTTRTWEDKQKNKRKSVEVIVEEINSLEKRQAVAEEKNAYVPEQYEAVESDSDFPF